MSLGKVAAFGLVLASLATPVSASPRFDSNNGVPAELLKKLKNGVNVTRWFCYQDSYDNADHNRNYLQNDDFEAFRKMDIGYVRLCLSPDAVYKDGHPVADRMPFVDAALSRFENAKMAVLFDLHDNGQLKLDTVGQDNRGLITFWEDVAKRYKGKMLNTVVFEIVNEPVFQTNPDTWAALQAKVVQAIRAIDPKRTIVVSPNRWSGIDALLQMAPLAEKNLIYTFHCYDPFWFTHQGATWAGDAPKVLANVPFPSSPELVAPVVAKTPAPYNQYIVDYGNSKFDGAYLMSRLQSAVDWGNKKGVPVLLGEFGSYPIVAPPASRARWFTGMRKAIDRLGVSNCIWGYDDGFGLGRSRDANGKLVLDPLTMRIFYGVK